MLVAPPLVEAAARHEIGLAIDLDENRGRAAALDGNGTLGRHARRLLVGFRKSGLAHQFGGGVQVALGFDQRLLALHHAGTGALAKLFD